MPTRPSVPPSFISFVFQSVSPFVYPSVNQSIKQTKNRSRNSINQSINQFIMSKRRMDFPSISEPAETRDYTKSFQNWTSGLKQKTHFLPRAPMSLKRPSIRFLINKKRIDTSMTCLAENSILYPKTAFNSKRHLPFGLDLILAGMYS